MALWVATLKSYIHGLLNHNHDNSSITINGETKVENKNSDDCNFEKYDIPSYFNVFNILGNFLPSKPQSLISFSYDSLIFYSVSNATYLLRAPPVIAY